ncbi:MAG: hypothetical protein QG588_216, partial [Candidatus Poribacteria bacterium]|nr:hypothetical protein [Candidatus Poribacteria bacterium]
MYQNQNEIKRLTLCLLFNLKATSSESLFEYDHPSGWIFQLMQNRIFFNTDK